MRPRIWKAIAAVPSSSLSPPGGALDEFGDLNCQPVFNDRDLPPGDQYPGSENVRRGADVSIQLDHCTAAQLQHVADPYRRCSENDPKFNFSFLKSSLSGLGWHARTVPLGYAYGYPRDILTWVWAAPSCRASFFLKRERMPPEDSGENRCLAKIWD